MQTIGVIGLGKIGLPAAENLLKSGFRVVGFRRSPSPEFERIGGVRVGSAQDVADQADVVLSCLPSVEALDDVVSGPQGLLNTIRPGQIVVELGSFFLADKQRQLALIEQCGARLIDGEVSGTPAMVGARKGVVFLAGDEQACKDVEPVIRGFADTSFYFGPFGAATKVKVINNLLVTLNVSAAAEAMALGLKAGVDVPTMIKAISIGSGSSLMFQIRAPWMAERRFLPPQGEVAQLFHYIDAAQQMGRELGSPTPLLDRAAELFQRADAMGLTHQDVAAIIKVIEQS